MCAIWFLLGVAVSGLFAVTFLFVFYCVNKRSDRKKEEADRLVEAMKDKKELRQ